MSDTAQATSQQNIDITRPLYASWNSGDRLDPAEYGDPAVELESPFSSVVGVPYSGYAEMEQWMRDVDEQFAEWRVHVDDMRAVADSVISIGSVHGRGRASESSSIGQWPGWATLAMTTESRAYGSTSTSIKRSGMWGSRSRTGWSPVAYAVRYGAEA